MADDNEVLDPETPVEGETDPHSTSSFTVATTPSDAVVILAADLNDTGESVPFNNGKSIKVVNGTTVFYSVHKEGYYPQTGTVVVNDNTLLRISLIPHTNVQYRIRINSEPNTATITLKSGSDPINNNSTGIGSAYLDVSEGDFVVYKIVADGYMKSSGSVVAYHSQEKTITLKPSEGESAELQVEVFPKVSYLRDDFEIRADTSTLTDLSIINNYGAVWLKQSDNTDLTFEFRKDVQRLNEDGTPQYRREEIGPNEYIDVPVVRDTWVNLDSGVALDVEQSLKDIYGVIYNGTPGYGDKIYITAPRSEWQKETAHITMFYPRTVQVTKQPTNSSGTAGVSNVRFGTTAGDIPGQDLPFWTSQLEDNEFIFTRTEMVNLYANGEIIYYEKTSTVEHGEGQPTTTITEIVPAMTETWAETTTGRFTDAEMLSKFGLIFDGTPKLGDTFTVGQLVAKTVESSNGVCLIETDYFVTPDITYQVMLKGYNNVLPRDTTTMSTINDEVSGVVSTPEIRKWYDINTESIVDQQTDPDHSYIEITQGTLYKIGKELTANTSFNIPVYLHALRNGILLDSQDVEGHSVPGVYSIDKLYFPESYPGKYLNYELVGGGGGAVTNIQLGYFKHKRTFHHTSKGIWHALYGNTGGSGAYTKGYLKIQSQYGEDLVTNVVVNVGKGGESMQRYQNSTPTVHIQGSETSLTVNRTYISAGGGYADTVYVEGNSDWYALSSIILKALLSIFKIAGGRVTFLNRDNFKIHNDLINQNGNVGDYYNGNWSLIQDSVASPKPPFGYGGGFNTSFNNINYNAVAESGGNGYGFVSVNDNPRDNQDITILEGDWDI